MAVVWIKTEEIHGRKAENEVQKGEGNTTHEYLVYFNKTGDIPQAYDAYNASGVPARGTSLGGAYVSNLSAEQHDGEAFIYHVTVKWTILKIVQQEKKPAANPTKWHITITGQWVPREETTTQTVDDLPIVNPVGDPFDPPLTETKYDERISVSYYTDAPAWTTIDSCKGKANSSGVTITIGPTTRTFATHTLKLEACQWSMEVGSDTEKMVHITFEFLYRPETWTVNLANKGRRILGGDSKPHPILDAEGQPVNDPQYLTADGTAVLGDGDVITTSSFENVEDASFSTLLTDIG